MSLTPATIRLDLKCGQSAIAQGKTCHKGGAIPRRAALAAGLTAGALGGALLLKGSRKAIFNAPGRARRAAQQGVTEAVHRATAKPPSMRFPKDGPLGTMRPPSKTERLHKAAQIANREAEQAISKAAQAEIDRTVAVASAMHKSGKAARASLRSGVRRHNLTVEKLRRRYEPGYRKPPRSGKRGDALLTPRLLRSLVTTDATEGAKGRPTYRADKMCGKSGIADNKKCTKSTTTRKVVAGLAVSAALTAGTLYALNRYNFKPTGTPPHAPATVQIAKLPETPIRAALPQAAVVSPPPPSTVNTTRRRIPLPTSLTVPRALKSEVKNLPEETLEQLVVRHRLTPLQVISVDASKGFVTAKTKGLDEYVSIGTRRDQLIEVFALRLRKDSSWELEVQFDGRVDRREQDTPYSDARPLIGRAASMTRDIITNLPDDTVLVAKPYTADGSYSGRAKLYQRLGFVEKQSDGWVYSATGERRYFDPSLAHAHRMEATVRTLRTKTEKRADSALGSRSDGASTAYYRTHPKARRHKVRHQAAINSQPDEVDRRVALTRERRRRGIAGKGGPDISHTSSGGTTLEAPSTNRARNGAGGKARLKADSPWAVGFDADDGKKYTKVVTNPETGRKNRVRYGAQGYTIAPGTPKGNNYCARSFGDMKSHGKDCSGPDRNTPLCLSRAKWRCSGKSSRRGDALTPGKSSA